jgi:hypothetical protein
MTQRTPSRRADAAIAGTTVVAAMVFLAAVGYGVGSLVGLAVPFGLGGLFAGVVAGLTVVHARFRRI